MTANELLHRTDMTKESILDSLQKFQVSNCVSKVRISRINQATGELESIDVPCGRCYHCKNTHVNEWFSRMSLHSEYYPYVYYITFTYASPFSASSVGCDYIKFDNGEVKRLCIGPQYEAALKDMHKRSGTHFTYNVNNKSHERKGLPALLNQSHMQKMIKLLRQFITNGAKLSYYYVGEYGHKHGHPHYHMILWSDKPIGNLYNKCRRAWSRAYCYTDDPKHVKPFRGQKNVHVFRCPFGHVDFCDLVHNGAFSASSTSLSSAKSVFAYVCKYLQKDDYNTIQVDAYYSKLPYQNKSYKDDELIQKEFQGDLFTLSEFRKKNAPFARCSNRRPIGRDYAMQHLDEFTQYATKIAPDAQGKSRIFPSYFRKLAKRQLFAFMRTRTYHNTSTISAGNMLGNIAYMEKLCSGLYSSAVCFLDEKVCGVPYSVGDELELPLLSFYDTQNGFHYKCRIYSHGSSFVCSYAIEKYNRSTRKFDFLGSLSCADFLKVYTDSYLKLMKYNAFYKNQQIYSNYCFDEFRRKVSSCGFDYSEILNESKLVFETQRKAHQVKYHLKHVSLEL